MRNSSPIDYNGGPMNDHELTGSEGYHLSSTGTTEYGSTTDTSTRKSRHISLLPNRIPSMQSLNYSQQDDLNADHYFHTSQHPLPFHFSAEDNLPAGMDHMAFSTHNLGATPPPMARDGTSTSTATKIEKDPSTEAVRVTTTRAVRMSRFREVLFVGVIAIAHFMTQAALGQALVPLNVIGATFKTNNMGEMSWFIAGYALTVGTFILISGRLGDILGHSRMFVFGYAWFGVWSAFAGFAAYPGRQIFFDVCRAMQGIGPAIIMPNGLALFGRAYPPGIKKNIVFSIFGAVAPAGFVVGGVSGSLFAQLVWWPWAFWTFGVACWGLTALSIMVIPKALRERPIHPTGFDFTGSFLGVTGLLLFNIAWNNAPLYGWGSPTVYFILIIGILTLIAFIWVEKRARYPILPIEAINGSVLFVLACVGIGWGAFGIWVFYIFRFLETIRGYSPLVAAATFGPAPICGLLAAGLTGFMLTHTPVSFTMMVSMFAFFIGIVICTTQPMHQTYWAQTFVSIVIMPFGMDMSFPAASVLLSNLMPPEHQGLAMSLVNTVVNYGISIALGVAGTVEVNVLKHKPLNELNSPEVLFQGYRAAWYTACGFSAFGVICGVIFFIKTYMREGWKVMDH